MFWRKKSSVDIPLLVVHNDLLVGKICAEDCPDVVLLKLHSFDYYNIPYPDVWYMVDSEIRRRRKERLKERT